MNGLAENFLQEVQLSESTDNSLVISAVMSLSAEIGFNRVNQSIISTAASELSTNILKYAGEGQIIISSCSCGGKRGIMIEAIDNGPGIDDLDMALRDRYSSGGTLGLGLASVKRIMDQLDFDTAPERGTRIKAVKWITP